MLKRTITYDDLDGNPVTEDFYFNLSMSDLLELQVGSGAGLEETLKAMLASGNYKAMLDEIKGMVALSVGRRSQDGTKFLKDPEFTKEFMSSEAFSSLFFEFMTDPNALPSFLLSVIPNRARETVLKNRPDLAPSRHVSVHAEPAPIPVPEKTFDDYTPDQLLTMSDEQFDKLVGTDPRKMTKDQMVIAMRRMTNKRYVAQGPVVDTPDL